MNNAEKVARWCERAAESIRSLDDSLWRMHQELGDLDKAVASMRAGEMLPPPPDVCIEGIEPIKPGTQEYEDKYGEQDRRKVRRDTESILRMEIEAYGYNYDEMLARVQETPSGEILSGDDLFWRLADVWHRAMGSR